MSGGYWNRMLEVDLTKGTIEKVPGPSEEVLRKWIGGTGLALHLLMQNIRPDSEALDPDTPIIVLTGPLTGTKAPSSSDWKMVSLRYDLPYHPAVSQAHGHFGARLKHAGYDGIIIKGQSPKPVYLWIDDEHVEIRDASKYWGMDTFETQRAIQIDHQSMESISVACIGPAGESMIPGASVRNDYSYGCSKGGLGVICGSKKLKAMAVRGSKTVPLHDYAGFIETCEEWRATADKLKDTYQWWGKPQMVVTPFLAEWGLIPAKNYTDPDWQIEFGKRFEEDLAKWKVTPVGSWECDFKCHNETLITTGPFAGTKVTGFSLEVMEGAATNLGIEDPGTVMAMANFYDAMGCCPSGAGRLIAMCFEMYEKGLLTDEDTGGLKLNWGNDEAARDLFMQMINREGLGAILNKGFREACKELGRGSENIIQHIKGVGFNDHDQKAWGLGFAFQSLISGAGPTWQGFGCEAYFEPDLGYEGPQDPATPDGKAEACYKTQVKKMWEDSIGICLYLTWGVPNITKMVPKAVSQATGWDIDWDEAYKVGERIIQLQRLFAIERGFKKEYDMDISPRQLEPLKGGPAKGRDLGPHLARMIDEYYTFLDWDLKTGAPSQERLASLGLADYRIGMADK